MTITKKVDADEGLKFYKLAEVALRNGKDSDQVWIVIKDSIYDVTTYADNHPGGPELILEYAGTDCTKDFLAIGHSSEAFKDLKKLKIGEIVEEDKKINRVNSKVTSNGAMNETKKKKKFGGLLFC